uniref:N-acetyltransferase 9 n=1 Tax=Cynoglossus semilaevis TaxID=244447 RepID=A0A3P8W359_CYNSE
RDQRLFLLSFQNLKHAMKINENTLLEGHRVVLVPYNAQHVPRYHEWMKSVELQQLTASEPLTLDQEYDMQRSWREDSDKCTFIILDKQQWADPSVEEEQCMLGDVNIFLTDPTDPTLAELEVMIAEPSYRGRGFGKEVTRMMIQIKLSILMFKKLNFKEVSVCKVFKEVTLEMTVDEDVRLRILDEMASLPKSPVKVNKKMAQVCPRVVCVLLFYTNTHM